MISAQYMLTHNLDTSDGLTNGATCVIKHIGQSPNPASVRPVIIWVLFDDQYVGKNRRMEYKNLYHPIISHDWTPILEISRKFTVGRYQNIHVIRKQFPFQPAVSGWWFNAVSATEAIFTARTCISSDCP